MRKKVFCILPILLVAVASSAIAIAAESEFFYGESYTLGKDENIKGDLFVVAGEITVEGKVDGNVYLYGGDVKFNGETTGSVHICGG